MRRWAKQLKKVVAGASVLGIILLHTEIGFGAEFSVDVKLSLKDYFTIEITVPEPGAMAQALAWTAAAESEITLQETSREVNDPPPITPVGRPVPSNKGARTGTRRDVPGLSGGGSRRGERPAGEPKGHDVHGASCKGLGSA